jgi:hydroxyacylglutathione hydrolase
VKAGFDTVDLLFVNAGFSTRAPLESISGDFLFVGSVCRPDLLGEEAKLGLAHELFQSQHVRLEAPPDSVQVYPGHGAGPLCGTGMSERAESSLGYGRRTNPLFRLTEEAFVAEILGRVPPMPTYYPRVKELNARGAEAFDAIPGTAALSPSEAEALMAEQDVVVLDLRRPEAFGGAHIRGSSNIGAGQNLHFGRDGCSIPRAGSCWSMTKAMTKTPARTRTCWIGQHSGLPESRHVCLDQRGTGV